MTRFHALTRALVLLPPAALAAAAAMAAGVEAKAGAASVGPFGLEVAVGVTCAETDLDLTSGDLSGPYEACNQITASGSVAVPSQASLTAGAAIALGDDFSVAAGATFSAVIAPLIASDFAYLEDDTPQSIRSYKARFDLNLDSLSLAAGDRIELLNGYSAGGDEWFRLAIDASGVLLEARRDSGTYETAALGAIIPAGFHTLEIAWIARSGTDGELMLTVDAGGPAGVNLDNDTGRIDYVRLGAVDGVVTTTTGAIHLDEFLSFR